MRQRHRAATLAVSLAVLAGCDAPPAPAELRYSVRGNLADPALDEVSGLQVSRTHPGVLWVHNDDGAARLHALDPTGASRGQVEIADADNRDWEDITLIPEPGGHLLVIGDIGDNLSRREDIVLYFVPEPAPGTDGRFAGTVAPRHVLRLRYPDGARDCESLAFDPGTKRLLLLTKRDRPPRLYAVSLSTALAGDTATLEALGPVAAPREPEPADRHVFGKRTPYIAQPTGMDISADGRRAAVISYRSLFLYDLVEGQDWPASLLATPMEILGPPALSEESVGFSPDGHSLYVTAEGVRAPLYRFDFLDRTSNASEPTPAPTED